MRSGLSYRYQERIRIQKKTKRRFPPPRKNSTTAPFPDPIVMPIEDVIDLHPFAPKEIRSVVKEYFTRVLQRRVYPGAPHPRQRQGSPAREYSFPARSPALCERLCRCANGGGRLGRDHCPSRPRRGETCGKQRIVKQVPRSDVLCTLYGKPLAPPLALQGRGNVSS